MSQQTYLIVADDLRQRSAALEALRSFDIEVLTSRSLDGAGRRFGSEDIEVLLIVGEPQAGASHIPESLAGARLVLVPAPPAQVGEALATWEQHLLEALGLERSEAPGEEPIQLRAPSPRDRDMRLDLLAIASSTGGPDALSTVFQDLPGDLGVPIVIVQHMPAEFTGLLAKRLNRCSALAVAEGRDGETLLPGHAYVAPGGFHMVLERKAASTILRLNEEPPVHSCRPAADPMFESVARLYGPTVLGVVLTGMGCDGLEGSRLLTEGGADVIVQDEDTSVVWGMPGFVARAGLASEVLPLQSIAMRIEQRIRHSHARGKRNAG